MTTVSLICSIMALWGYLISGVTVVILATITEHRRLRFCFYMAAGAFLVSAIFGAMSLGVRLAGG